MDRKHVCILPGSVPVDSSSSSSRFLRLPHPRTHQPALFVPFEREAGSEESRDGLLEVQKVQFDADKSRCWFIEQDVVSDGSISLFSPFDPVFLAISYLTALQPHYLSYADTWDAIASHQFEQPRPADGKKAEEGKEEPSFVEDLTRLGQMKCVKERLMKVCETQEHEGTTLYRVSQPSVLALLKAKIEALAKAGEGVFGPLESTSPGEKKAEEVESAADENAPPPAKKRRFSTVTRGLGKEAVGNGHGLSEEIQTEARQRYAVGIIANYLPPALAQTLLASYTFPTLTAYLSTNTGSSVLNTTYLPGRGSAKFADDGADLGGGSAAKKRKAEASKGSRGVEALKKVNTKGMSSLKDMFAKQATAPKKEKAAPAASAAAKKGKKKA
ncbi:hypothetical protein JCM6882_006164 [Rhodosporidiobolus microsporus]